MEDIVHGIQPAHLRISMYIHVLIWFLPRRLETHLSTSAELPKYPHRSEVYLVTINAIV